VRFALRQFPAVTSFFQVLRKEKLEYLQFGLKTYRQNQFVYFVPLTTTLTPGIGPELSETTPLITFFVQKKIA
jgi:hypothetical protein